MSLRRDTRLSIHVWSILSASVALAILLVVKVALASQAVENTTLPPLPSFSHPGGAYQRDVLLEIVPPWPGAQIRFTIDGRIPTEAAGTLVTHPISLRADEPGVTVIRARIVLPDGDLGPVISASYVMNLDATLPVVSLIMDPADLWDAASGIYQNPLGRGEAWERPVNVTYVDPDRTPGFSTDAGIRVHGYQSRAYAKKSLRLYFRSEYGMARLEYPLFQGSSVTSFNRLVLHNGGQDFAYPPLANWTLMRNQLAADLAFDLGIAATESRPALLFINGEPWGIYQIRERPDEDFLLDHHGLASADFLESPESSLRDVLTGDREHWDDLMTYVDTHDLAATEAYAYVRSQVDIDNFIDYHILQIYSANTDWPAHNIHLFRPRTAGGRWQWMVWDSDNGFGADTYSQVDSDMISHLLDYNHPETGGRDVLLFRKLLANADFRTRLLSRAADLLNTVLAPKAVIAHIDELAAELAPDIAYETHRWPSQSIWTDHIQQLRDFATDRPGYVRQHFVERLGLGGTIDLTINPPGSGAGTVAVNGSTLSALPWQGTAFRGVTTTITAVPDAGYTFAGWSEPDLPAEPVIALLDGVARPITPNFVKLDRAAIQAGDVVVVNVHIDDTGEIEGDWFELLVARPGGVDLRGWRLTDNDTKSATDEGSLIFSHSPALARVPAGTALRIIATETPSNAQRWPQDDVASWDRQMVLYAGNDDLDSTLDPWFNLGPHDNLVVLASGPTPDFDDDQGIAFWGYDTPVTPASFGILADGVIDDR
ncbi:MAG: CotH kinase family protein [Anaerolineae bacterium]|nr:CotH kinase family protein [Anaerolineae bacterium]